MSSSCLKPENDNRDAHLVYGWIRDQSDMLGIEIPVEIIQICLLQFIMMSEKQIQLKVHSHKGDQDDPPHHMLNSYPSYYYSKIGTIRDDWIIFEPLDDNLYFVPTKVELGLGRSDQAIKDFNIWCGHCGDNKNQEWVKCNDHTLSASTMTTIQSFQFNGIWDIFDIVREKKYRHYKFEILNNHGDPNYIEGRQFKLYGITVY